MAEWIDEYQLWLTEDQSLQNAQLIANHFSGTDWAKESVAALVGNMRHESSVNPNMYEFGYDWADDRGYGLVQWTPRSKYWDWAVANGLTPENGDSQLARIDYEADNNIQWIATPDAYNLSFDEFRTNAQGLNVNQLTAAFTWGYERPLQSAGEASMPERQAFAQKVMTEISFEGGTGTKPALPVKAGTPTTDTYGPRIDPISGEQSFHAGLDYAGETNDPIYATMTGKVEYAGFNNGGLGNVVWVKHSDDKYYSAYAHLESFNVSAGDTVTKGQQIGGMGTTGYSTGVHLHFVIATTLWGNNASNTIDPQVYLDTEQGGGGDDTSTPSPIYIQPAQHEYETEGTLNDMAYYEIKPGDTLGEIAAEYGVTVSDIKRVRYVNILNPDVINVGDVVLIPNSNQKGWSYTIKPGDTLSEIAQIYGTTVDQIMADNNITSADNIQAGWVIIV